MPEFVMPYFEAVKRWNLGGTSWCLPRKGTAGYDTVMAIRRGEPAKSRQEEVEAMVKGEKRKVKKRIRVTQNVSLKQQEEMAEKVELPTVESYGQTKVLGKKKVRLPKKKSAEPVLAPVDVDKRYGFFTNRTEQIKGHAAGTTLEPAVDRFLEFIKDDVRRPSSVSVRMKKSKDGEVTVSFERTVKGYSSAKYVIEPEFRVVEENPEEPEKEKKGTEKKSPYQRREEERKRREKAAKEEAEAVGDYGDLKATPVTTYVDAEYEGKTYKKVVEAPDASYMFSAEDEESMKKLTPKRRKFLEGLIEKLKKYTVAPAVDSYIRYILEINKERKSPVRHVEFKVEMEKKGGKETGRKLAKFYHVREKPWYLRSNMVDALYPRTYVIEPKFEPLA